MQDGLDDLIAFTAVYGMFISITVKENVSKTNSLHTLIVQMFRY